MAIVFGKKFVEERTSSCEYHLSENTKRHAKYVSDADRKDYYTYISDMKKSTTEKEYEQSKKLLEMLIKSQSEKNRHKLASALSFWHERRCRWALAFKTTAHNIPRSSLAESAHASMKAGNQKNLSLVDAVYADVTDSARLEAIWSNRKDGEKCSGSGPTGHDLSLRSEIRQVAKASYLIDHERSISSSDDDLLSLVDHTGLYDPKSTHRSDKRTKPPYYAPKVKKRGKRSLESQCFKEALQKAKEMSLFTKVISVLQRSDQVVVEIEQSKRKFKVTFAEDIFCTCSPSQRVDRKTCSHVIWLYKNLFKMSDDDIQIAQVTANTEELKKLINACPDEVPLALKECYRGLERKYHPRVRRPS